MIDYFFFEDFLLPLLLLPLLDFFDEDLALLFFAAISAHHLSCRTGPPGRASGHNTPDRSGKLARMGDRGKEHRETGADDLRRT
jgi:hypothetical protein